MICPSDNLFQLLELKLFLQWQCPFYVYLIYLMFEEYFNIWETFHILWFKMDIFKLPLFFMIGAYAKRALLFCIFWSSVVNLTRFKAMFHFYWVYWRNTCLKWVQELHANSVNVLRSIFLFLRYFRILSFNFRVSFILPLFLSELLGKNKNLRQIYSGNVLLLFWYIFCELFYNNLTV